MTPTAQQLYEVCDHTWPAARRFDLGPWVLRDGQGGGKRVSAATANGPVGDSDIAQAETEMAKIGQAPLFMIGEGAAALDAQLAAKGYQIIDPVNIYCLPLEKLTDKPIPRVTAFEIWEPLAIMAEIWAAGGIGPARLAVMGRAAQKTAIFGRLHEKPAGVAFAAIHDGICMVHAVEVLAHQRRQGMAEWLMRRAALWAQGQGASQMAVLCVEQNRAANALYQALGFTAVGGYHYRHRP